MQAGSCRDTLSVMKTTKYQMIQAGNYGPPDECWLFDGALNHAGYGQLKAGATTTRAHRLSYSLHKGSIPEGVEVDHICFQRACWNPAHLRLTDRSENTQRRRTPAIPNTSGYRGVYWERHVKKWRARVQYRGQCHNLGLFTDVHEAGAAAEAKRTELGFLT